MVEELALTAADGHRLKAFLAKPEGTPRGGLVIGQDIFGANRHFRNVIQRFAADGYVSIVPALFDRHTRDSELRYNAEDRPKGMAMAQAISTDQMMLDMTAARDAVAGYGKVGVVGYCLGGSLAWFCATRQDGFSASVGYYGGMVTGTADEKPRCPVMLHYADSDATIPLEDYEHVKATVDPSVEVFLYPGRHGFDCDIRDEYHPESAKLARGRTVAFLHRHI